MVFDSTLLCFYFFLDTLVNFLGVIFTQEKHFYPEKVKWTFIIFLPPGEGEKFYVIKYLLGKIL